MKFIQKISIISIAWFLIMGFYAQAKEIIFNGEQARKYAFEHCGTGTPPDKGYNHEKYICFNSAKACTDKNQTDCCKKNEGTDCANFVSQALIDGGITFSDCINTSYKIKGKDAKCENSDQLTKGTYTIGKDEKTKGVIKASDLEKVLKGSYCFQAATEPKAGDVIVLEKNKWGCADHVGIVMETTNKY